MHNESACQSRPLRAPRSRSAFAATWTWSFSSWRDLVRPVGVPCIPANCELLTVRGMILLRVHFPQNRIDVPHPSKCAGKNLIPRTVNSGQLTAFCHTPGEKSDE